MRNSSMNRAAFCAVFMAAITLLTGTARATDGGRTLSLQEAIDLALKQNNEIKASESTVDAARYELKSSYGKFLPQINVDGRYTKLNAPIDLDLNPIRDAIIQSSATAASALPAAQSQTQTATQVYNRVYQGLNRSLPSFSEEIQKENFWNATLTATQPIFAGGKIIANTKAKKEGLAATEEQDRATRDKITADAANRYFAVQLMRKVVDIRKEVMDGLQEHENHASRMFSEGVLSKANKMRSDVALAEAKREYSKALQDQELAVILLNNVLGTNETSFNTVTPLFLAQQVNPLETYIEKGVKQNPNLQVLSHRSGQLEQKYRAGVGNFLPTLALFGSYELYKKDLTVLQPEWAVGVAARINIFSGGADLYDVKTTARERVALEYYTDNAQDLVKTEIRKYYHDLNTAKEQYGSLETSRSLAEENLRLNELSFRQGVATALEVIDAQLNLGKVKVDQARALYDCDVALAQLLRASGNARAIIDIK